MDWNDLRYFLAAARAGSLAAAARELKCEHTTVGRRIAALESALSAKLFARTPDGLVLTETGRSILPLAESAAEAMNAVLRKASAQDVSIEGTVRLSTSEALAGFIIKRMGELRRRHPQLVVEVVSTNRSVDLARGEADLAVRAAPMESSELTARKIGVAGWTMYASRSYIEARGKPEPVTALAGHDVIGFDDTLSRTPGGAWLGQHACAANLVMRANSIVAAMNAALVGIGLAVMPCLVAGTEAELQRVTPEVLGARDVWLVVHPDLADVGRVRAVFDYVVAMFERERVLISGQP
jgi:DNA-binding transcriptional LysR family regulator